MRLVPDLDDHAHAERALLPSVTRRRLMVADAAAAIVVCGVALAILVALRPMSSFTLGRHLLVTVGSVPAFCVGAITSQMYRARANQTVASEFRNITKTVTVGSGFLIALAFAAQVTDLSRLWVAVVALSTLGALTIERAAARRVFARLRADGRMCRRIVIVGTDTHALRLQQLFERDPSLGYHVVGLVGDEPDRGQPPVGVLGDLDEVKSVLAAHDASGVVMSPSALLEHDINALTRDLTDAGYHVAISASLKDIDVARLRPQNLGGRSVLYVEPVARTGAPVVAKRVFDIVVASTLLVLTAPVALVAMVAIKLTSPGPVLFKQTRVGLDGKEFTMVKLRTMVVDAEDRLSELAELNEADGPLFKIGDDPRITKVGRFLRRSSIDELPQLLAVLRGTMSMVGPRPALVREVESWDDLTKQRLRVLPGLTGLWQVSGRSDASFDAYRRLDLFYVDNWSLRHDLRICVRTIGVVLSAHGAR